MRENGARHYLQIRNIWELSTGYSIFHECKNCSFLCLCTHACQDTCMCRAMHTYGACVHEGPSQPQVSLLSCHPHFWVVLFCFVFCFLRHWSRLNWLGREPPSIPISTPYLWYWDYKYVPLNTDLTLNCREQSRVFLLAQQARTLPTDISPHL